MAYGLEIWNAAGNKTVSITDRLARYHNTYVVTLTSGQSSVYLSVPGLDVAGGTWFFAVTNGSGGAAISASADGITFTHPRAASGYTFSGGTVTIVVWRT